MEDRSKAGRGWQERKERKEEGKKVAGRKRKEVKEKVRRRLDRKEKEDRRKAGRGWKERKQ